MKPFTLLLPLCLLVSCSAPRAVYDYDEQANFSSFSTYDIYPELETGLSPLDEKRIIISLGNGFSSKGFSTSQTPQVYVNVFSQQFQEAGRNRIGVGVGGTGRNVGVGVSGGIPIGGPEIFLRLTFDLIDVQTDDLLWQAVVENKFDPEASPQERQALFDKMVAKALEGYPPKKTLIRPE